MITLRPNTAEFRRKFPRLIQQAKNPRQLLLGVGREGATLLKTHFREKDRTNVNKLNPDRREHLWLRISRGVQAPVVDSPTQVSIAINDPVIAQKVFGGVITAKRVKNLSIPEEPEAYGRSPRTFEAETGCKLFLLKQNSHLLLARKVGEHGVQVEYLLTPRVNQQADPSALPEEKLFTQELIERGQQIVDRQNNLN